MESAEIKRELFHCLKYRLPVKSLLTQAIDEEMAAFKVAGTLTEYYCFQHAALKSSVMSRYLQLSKIYR